MWFKLQPKLFSGKKNWECSLFVVWQGCSDTRQSMFTFLNCMILTKPSSSSRVLSSTQPASYNVLCCSSLLTGKYQAAIFFLPRLIKAGTCFNNDGRIRERVPFILVFLHFKSFILFSYPICPHIAVVFPLMRKQPVIGWMSIFNYDN